MLKSVVALALTLCAAGTSAVTLLTATPNNASENPPTLPISTTGAPRPASFGIATFVINDAMTSMTFSATIFNIDVTSQQTADVYDNLGNADIHASPTVTPTTNGPVVWGLFGNPFNDNAPNDAVVTPFTTGVGGTFSGKWDAPEGNNTTFAAQLDNILAGRAYINFQTTLYADGEIRGSILVSAVPEPETRLLLMAGLAGVLAAARRQRSTVSRA